jgi:tRNA-binding protein
MSSNVLESSLDNVFAAVDIRAGTIVAAEPLVEARKPSYKLKVDFGERLGIKQSAAQITVHYTPAMLIGKQVLAVVNLSPRRIAGFSSEVLVLGVPDAEGAVVLLRPDQSVANGVQVF